MNEAERAELLQRIADLEAELAQQKAISEKLASAMAHLPGFMARSVLEFLRPLGLG